MLGFAALHPGCSVERLKIVPACADCEGVGFCACPRPWPTDEHGKQLGFVAGARAILGYDPTQVQPGDSPELAAALGALAEMRHPARG